jgi:hypothetical protein
LELLKQAASYNKPTAAVHLVALATGAKWKKKKKKERKKKKRRRTPINN